MIPTPSPYVNHDGPEHLTFPPNQPLPAHLTHWRFPIPSSYTPSPPSHPNTLRLTPSTLNLTALNGNYAGPTGQTFISRRQQHTLFTYSVTLDFSPSALEEEAGVTAFLTQNHHLDMGIVLLPRGTTTTGTPPPGFQTDETSPNDGFQPSSSSSSSKNNNESTQKDLTPHIRFRAESYVPVPAPLTIPLPEAWRGGKLALEIRACNRTHYAFSVGPAGRRSEMREVMVVSTEGVSWGFTGELFFFFLSLLLCFRRGWGGLF
jgi:hypothetical protein